MSDLTVTLEYPTSLPLPVAMPFVPAPRVRRTEMVGQVAQAARERDFRGTGDVEWQLTGAEAWVLDMWWRYTTRQGGSKWACTWPTPMGWAVPHVRRFTSPLSWAIRAEGSLDRIWRVTARTEILGRHVGTLKRPVETVFDLPEVWLWFGTLDLAINDRWVPDFEPADFGWRGTLDQALNADMPVA